MKMKRILAAAAALSAAAWTGSAQEMLREGDASYASYTPWSKARTFDADGKVVRRGDQSRIMQNRPLYLVDKKSFPLPTNDWWTDALVSRWTGNLWSYPAKVVIGASGVRVAFPTYWIDNGTEVKERSAVVVGAKGAFNPDATLVESWHDWDVEMVLRDGAKSMRTTLVHGSPFTWIEYSGVKVAVTPENGPGEVVDKSAGGYVLKVGDDHYGVWEDGRSYVVIGLLPSRADFSRLAPYATAIIRSTRVDWKYDEKTAELTTTWNVMTEDLTGKAKNPIALQGFQPHHLRRTKPQFKTLDGISWLTPRGEQRIAAGNSLSIVYAFPGLLPCWAAPAAGDSEKSPYRADLFRRLLADYAERGNFGGDTYWGGKGLFQMAGAMMAAREIGDAATFAKARERLRAQFEDWLTWTPGEDKFYFSYIPRWGGLVGENTSYDSDAFNDHHFHYGYFTWSGALLCLVDEDFKSRFGGMLKLIAKDYANWDRTDKRFPLFRTFDPWAGHSFAGGIGDGAGNGQESSSEAMQGWGGLYLLGLALGDDDMRDAGIFGYVSEARGTAEYWFDRDRKNIDYMPRRRLVDLLQRRPRVDAFDTVASKLACTRLPERRPQVREMGLRHDVGLEARVRLGRRARQRLIRKRRAQLPPAQRSRAGRGDIRQARARRARRREERRHGTSHLLGYAQPPVLGRARLLRSRRLPGRARFREGRQAHVHGVERGQCAAQGQVLRREGRNALHP